MSILKLFRILLKIGKNAGAEDFFKSIIERYFPELISIPEAIAEVGESFLYISYEAKDIEKKIGDVKELFDEVKYEARGIQKSLERYSSRTS